MWKLCAVVSFVAAMAVTVGPALAIGVSDGFEDGDWTANPAWVRGDAGYGIDGGIVADPVRPANLAWKAQATDAWIALRTKDFSPIAWSGFIASVEFCTSTSTQYGASLGVVDVYGSTPENPREKSFELYVYDDWARYPQPELILLEDDQMYHTPFDRDLMPANEWVRLQLWHDVSAGLIRGEMRKMSDNSLIVGSSFTPISVGGSKPLAEFKIGVKKPSWQYMDNAMLTPEPTSLVVLTLGSLALMRRRRTIG